MLGLALVLDLDDGLAALVDDLEWEMFDVGLNLGITELSTDETFGVEDGVLWVHGDLILGGITDETFSIGKGNKGRSGSIALIIGNDFDAVISEDAYTGVGRTLIGNVSL